MALNPLQVSVIRKAAIQCRTLLQTVLPDAEECRILYEAVDTGFKDDDVMPPQDVLDHVPLSCMTKTELNDALYALDTTVRDAIFNAYTQLAKLAARANQL